MRTKNRSSSQPLRRNGRRGNRHPRRPWTGGRKALGSEEQDRRDEEPPKGGPSSQEGLSTQHEQGESSAEETEGVTQEETSALSRELEDVRRERDEYLDNLRRMKAEFDNSRTRLEREHARSVELASERLVTELFPILDNLERALEADGDVKEGQSFDPAVHEALMGKPSEEHEEDTVIQTLERGYVLNGKPIRAAKVVVSKRA